MIGKGQYIANGVVPVHEHVVFCAADRPVDHIDFISDHIRAEVLERQIAVAGFGYDDAFVGAVSADERRGNIAAASDGLKSIARGGLAAHEHDKRQEHRAAFHWIAPFRIFHDNT